MTPFVKNLIHQFCKTDTQLTTNEANGTSKQI